MVLSGLHIDTATRNLSKSQTHDRLCRAKHRRNTAVARLSTSLATVSATRPPPSNMRCHRLADPRTVSNLASVAGGRRQVEVSPEGCANCQED